MWYEGLMFLVRCRYIAHGGRPEGVGYLDAESRCTSDRRYAFTFETEADGWVFAANSGEAIPGDCWVEESVP